MEPFLKKLGARFTAESYLFKENRHALHCCLLCCWHVASKMCRKCVTCTASACLDLNTMKLGAQKTCKSSLQLLSQLFGIHHAYQIRIIITVKTWPVLNHTVLHHSVETRHWMESKGLMSRAVWLIEMKSQIERLSKTANVMQLLSEKHSSGISSRSPPKASVMLKKIFWPHSLSQHG